MAVELTISRKFLHGPRPVFFYFLEFTVFPLTETNADYPGAAALITVIKGKFTDYGIAHSAKKTTLADEIYETILTETVGLIKYVEANCGNNLAKLEETGFKANKTSGTPEPLPEKVKNVNSMSLGGQKMKFEYECNDSAHFFLARIRKKGGSDADWVMNGRSESHTMFITEGLDHGIDYEIQICGNGTKGAGDWSDVKSFLVD